MALVYKVNEYANKFLNNKNYKFWPTILPLFGAGHALIEG